MRIGGGEVLVRVEATTVNPADLGMRNGRYRWFEPVRLPIIPGYDVVGTVVGGSAAWPDGTPVLASTGHSRLLASGQIAATPVADVLPLTRAADAHRRVAAGGVGGKLVCDREPTPAIASLGAR